MLNKFRYILTFLIIGLFSINTKSAEIINTNNLTFSGRVTITNLIGTVSNSILLNGLTSEEIMQVGATYFFTTNIISYGAVTGRQASLTVPTVAQSLIYSGPVTSGQYFASYLIPSNQMPSVLEVGTYVFQFFGGHITNPSKDPTIMGDLYVKNAATDTTIQEFESLPVVIPYGTNEPFKIQITITNAYPRDGYAFLLKTKLVNADGYTGDYKSQFGPRGYAGFTISRASGVYVSHAEWNNVTPYRVNWNTNNTYSAGTTQDFRNAEILSNTQYLYFVSSDNCSGIWMDADKQYVFKIKAGVYSCLTNTIPSP